MGHVPGEVVRLPALVPAVGADGDAERAGKWKKNNITPIFLKVGKAYKTLHLHVEALGFSNFRIINKWYV